MYVASHGISPSLPEVLFYQPPCVKGFPSNVEVSDAWAKIGSGAGNEIHSLQAALGEYFERRHFYMEVFPELYSTLTEHLDKNETAKFVKAFKQTAGPEYSNADLQSHIYGLSKVTRLSDFSSSYIPTATISISYNNNNDHLIYPSRDTCGCSFHWSAQEAIFGSLKESLERQFLTRFWLTKECADKLTSHEITALLSSGGSSSLYEALSASGDIIALDISDYRFPGKCIIMFYGSSTTEKNVHYCTGMSYAETLEIAIKKSLNELWQTYRFMDLHATLYDDNKNINDPYLRHFLNCNSYETFKEISNFRITNESQQRMDNLNLQNIIKTFRQLNLEGYIYTKSICLFEKNYTFSKFISPSLFLHMDNSKNINIDNDYSKSFLTKISPSRKKIMVPFP